MPFLKKGEGAPMMRFTNKKPKKNINLENSCREERENILTKTLNQSDRHSASGRSHTSDEDL